MKMANGKAQIANAGAGARIDSPPLSSARCPSSFAICDLRFAISRRSRGFSIVELLIALTISSMLLSACLVALDGTFKSYQATTESASTHVVSRLVMTRIMSMIRQGKEFGPYPPGVVNPTQIQSQFLEFVSLDDADTGERQVTRLEKVADAANPGSFVLQYNRTDFLNGVEIREFSHPLIRNLKEATFTLEYDVGPRLLRATVDLAVKPDDNQSTAVTSIHSDLANPVLRLISSTSPRKLD
jgi:prepilin-type N-terminal cleavage/methylation domain-containing protein